MTLHSGEEFGVFALDDGDGFQTNCELWRRYVSVNHATYIVE